MEFIPTPLPGILIVSPKIYRDERGYFMETYQQAIFQKAGISVSFIQDNQSASHQGVLRGLHFQFPFPQAKLIRVIAGEIFDVAVDIRKDSTTFGKWYGTNLSGANKKMLWIPEGFAHGFYTLSKYAKVVYKVSDCYFPQHQHTLVWNDPSINIKWPLIGDKKPILSAKDASGQTWQEILSLI
jgi:dTDP-4-dehydrorhamnose 3,5-epimerase